MNELVCIQISLPTGVNCYVSYYRGNGEVGGVEVVTLVWRWIRVGSRTGREQSPNDNEKSSTTIMNI